MTTTLNPTSSTRTKIGGSPTLIGSIKSEWVKLRTVRSPWIIAGIVTVITALSAGLSTYSIQQELGSGEFVEGQEYVGATVGMPLANYLGIIAVVIIGGLIGSGDFQHKTINPTLINQPKRSHYLIAKTGFAFAVSVALSVFLIAVTVAVSFIFSPSFNQFYPLGFDETSALDAGPAGLFSIASWAIAHLVLAGLFGTGLGLATRSTAFAVSGFFVIRFVELVASRASSHWVTNLLPFKAGDRLLPYFVSSNAGQLESKPASAAIYLTFIAALFAIGIARTYKQDVS